MMLESLITKLYLQIGDSIQPYSTGGVEIQVDGQVAKSTAYFQMGGARVEMQGADIPPRCLYKSPTF